MGCCIFYKHYINIIFIFGTTLILWLNIFTGLKYCLNIVVNVVVNVV